MSATTPPTTTTVEPRGIPVVASAPAPAPLDVRPPRGDDDVRAWSAYAADHPAASVFHDPRWCEAVAEVFGHTPRHLLAWRGERVVGVLPLMRVQSVFGGRMLVSVPYGTYGGLLADEPSVAHALAEAARALAEDEDARVLELRSAVAAIEDFEPVDGYVGFTRDLPAPGDDAWRFLPRKARAAARNAQDRDHVVIRHDDTGVAAAWNLYACSMRRLGSINYPQAFFEALRRRFRGQFWVTFALRDDLPIAATISLVHGRTVMPYVVGAEDRMPGSGVASLLYLGVLRRAVEAGLRRWDFGRSRADNAGAVAFKQHQGFEPQALGYQRYVPGGRVAPNLRPSGSRFALARRIWPHLPLAVTQPLGAWLARSLPG